MGKPITTEIAVAYTHCPRKAFLLLNAASPPPPHEYESLCRGRVTAHRERYAAQLRRDGHGVASCDGEGLGAGHPYFVGVDLQASDLSGGVPGLLNKGRRDIVECLATWTRIPGHWPIPLAGMLPLYG